MEIDRLVPASGNLGICGQQFWLGPARAGRKLTLWIDTTTVHLNLDGQHLKTLPSRLSSIDLARLRAQGAPRRPAASTTLLGPAHRGCSRGNPPHRQGRGHGLHRRHPPLRLAGRRITLRLETTVAHVIIDGVLPEPSR